ncbi:max dimerization protein 3 isoform X2 [Mustela lutreola]|uniref:max dimerization protein 3 isoform X2 n=1 Tax=Mustela lutreola TaxID=9666 RepID=UPI0027979DF0|nr:max dimerization protein 3 isoform X2 [Mustela lutreola]
MESVASNIQVLLQAAEFLERRERGAPAGTSPRLKRAGALSGRSRAWLCVPVPAPQSRPSLQEEEAIPPSFWRAGQWAVCAQRAGETQKLEEQEQKARRLKEKLRSEQQSLRQQLEQLRAPAGLGERERPRADSLDSSGLSSERSDSDQEEVEVDVESLVFGGEAELLRSFSAGQEHSYSHGSGTWL